MSDETMGRLRGYGIAYAAFLTSIFGPDIAKTSMKFFIDKFRPRQHIMDYFT